MIAYKFLRGDGSSVFTGFRWPLPDGAPGAWVDAPVDPCRSGIHACRPADLPYWIGRSLYEVELAGDIVEEPTKLVASRARLLRPVAAWNDGAARRVHAHVRRPRACARARRLATAGAVGRGDRAVRAGGTGAARLRRRAHRRGASTAPPPTTTSARRQTAWLVERLGLQDAAAS